jgi:hypothetical protein
MAFRERFPLGRSNSVAAVAGVVGAFVGRKETECGRDEVAHLLEGAGTHRAEERLWFGEGEFDGLKCGLNGGRKRTWAPTWSMAASTLQIRKKKP